MCHRGFLSVPKIPADSGKDKEKKRAVKAGDSMGRREESEKEDTRGSREPWRKRENARQSSVTIHPRNVLLASIAVTKGTGKRRRVSTSRTAREDPGGDSSVAWSRDGNK